MELEKDSFKLQEPTTKVKKFWGPIPSILLVIYTYVASLALGTILVSVYPVITGMSAAESDKWLASSFSQFWLILVVDSVVLLIVRWLLHLRKASFATIGFRRPKGTDILYALGGFIAYFLLYIVVTVIAKALFPSLNLEQNQQIGFEAAKETGQLILVFISLVLIPPVVEEILFRGFLYTGLKTKWHKWAAALVTSVVFAVAHLQFGSGAPLLWVAAIDTFALSLVLVYLREKTGSLGAPIMLHMLKNGIAFTLLFIVGVV